MFTKEYNDLKQKLNEIRVNQKSIKDFSNTIDFLEYAAKIAEKKTEILSKISTLTIFQTN